MQDERVDHTDVKKWLYRGMKLSARIENLNASKLRAMARATKATPTISKARGTSGINTEKVASIPSIMEDCDAKIKAAQSDYDKAMAEIESVIYTIENQNVLTVFLCRYVDFMPWHEIAIYMNFSVDHVRGKLHRRGLREIKTEILKREHRQNT